MREATAIPFSADAFALPTIDFRSAFEQMAQGVVIFDRLGRSSYANPAAVQILGVRLEELNGTLPTPLVLVDVTGREIPDREQALARVLATGVAVNDFVVGTTRSDGARQWLNASVAAILQAGTITGAIATFTDVTHARSVTETLQSSEAIHRQLMHALADGVFVARDFQLIFANPAFGELLGHAPEAVNGLSFKQFVPKETYGLWIENYAQLLGHGPDPERRYETRLLHADGQTRIDVEIVATRTRYGDRPAVLGVVRDIRERLGLAAELAQYRSGLEELVIARTAESSSAMTALQDSEQSLRRSNAALADAEKFTRDIADNLPVRIAYWDRAMQCRFVNRAYCDWFGKPADGLLGRGYAALFAERKVTARVSEMTAALAGVSQQFKHEHVAADGTSTHALIHLIPDLKGNHVHGVLVLAIDMTQETISQAALELLNEQLVVARDRAESAGRAKSAFLANMSHEIRTPMNAIIGLTHLLKKDVLDPAQGERLGRIADAAHHLLQIINDVLDLSKIEAGKAVVEATPFDVAQMLRAACAMVEEKAAAKGLVLRIDAGALPAHAVGDPTRISQALVNLVDNAVKFTERGAVEVHGSVLESASAGTLLRFEVRDSGIGIAPEQLSRLFSAFEQAESSTNRRFGGTGLGLSLTRHLARLMGGDAGAVSEPGRGSTFWITVRVGAAEASFAPAPIADAAEFLRSAHAGARVLVAEDNLINQEVAISLLEAVGLAVDLAENGQVAIDLAARNDYALVLMDMQMPGVDGLEASRAIRLQPRGASLPIVAMTANAFAEDRAVVLEAGMNDHLGKPVDPPTLYATVARWLGPRKAASPQATLRRVAALDELDVERGMAFFAGRPEPYLQALDTFVRLYAKGWAGVGEGVDDAAARRELHSTGSACASVGAAKLASFAHELLGHGRDATRRDAKLPVPPASLEAFAGRLTRLSEQIAERLAA